MSKIADLLAAEEDAFRREELILRQFAFHVRGVRNEHLDPLVTLHLKDCSDYFSMYGTIDGPLTPWMIGNRRMDNGQKKENS